MASNYDSGDDRTNESESECTDKSYFPPTDSEEEQKYSSGAFQNANYDNLDYDTGDDEDDPAFLSSMSTRSKTESGLPSALNKGDDSTKKRSRGRLSDPDPRDLSKRPRTGGVKGKGKGPTKAQAQPPRPPPASSRSTAPPPSNPTFPPSQHAIDTQQPLEPATQQTMPSIHPHLPQRKTSFQEWVDQLLSREEEQELDDYAGQFFSPTTRSTDLNELRTLRTHIKHRVVIAAQNTYKVPVDFTQQMDVKDHISPASGLTHAPGKKLSPLEHSLPRLRPPYHAVCEEQMAGLRKKNTATPQNPPPTSARTSLSPMSASKKAGKARKKKKKNQKVGARKELEGKLDLYHVIEAPNGVIVEDELGIPLIIIVRDVFPQTNMKSMNETATKAAAEFSRTLKSSKNSSFRDEHKRIPQSLFKEMQAHFALWWAIGHAHKPPTFSSDMKGLHNMQAWVQFFHKVDPILHAINCVADCVDFKTMGCYRQLKDKTINSKERGNLPPGSFMGVHASHWVNIAVHANQLPSKPHKDLLSNHNGYDAISSFGQFTQCWICFPHLGIRILVNILDVCLLRGAALFHHMYRWKGLGRFVIVPFVDRHLFPTQRVQRPKFPLPLFRQHWKTFRSENPAKPLPTFVP